MNSNRERKEEGKEHKTRKQEELGTSERLQQGIRDAEGGSLSAKIWQEMQILGQIRIPHQPPAVKNTKITSDRYTHVSKMNDEQTNEEIEKIAGMMMGDGISPDEQDHAVLEKYQAQIEQDCGVGSEDSAKILYETLLYLKMKGTKSGDFLEKGNEFGAGFS